MDPSARFYYWLIVPRGPASPAPVIISVTPKGGSSAGGTPVRINGTDFVTGATVDFDGSPATNVVVVSAILITCDSPAHGSADPIDVLVTNPDGQTSLLSGAASYTYFDPPTAMSLTSYQRFYDFASAPWVGTASAGISGTLSEKPSPNNPTNSAPLNGIVGAQYTRVTRTTITAVTVGGAAVPMEDLVANAAYTVSFLADIQAPAIATAFAYQRSSVLQADAHWGWSFESAAALTGQTVLRFNSIPRTIVRDTGSFITDGFVVGQTIYVARSVSNNGYVGAAITNVTATTLTFGVGAVFVDEVLGMGADGCVSAGPYAFIVFNYTGTFPYVSVAVTPGLHWFYVRRTSSGTIQIDIDGVAGTPTALPDHAGASAIQAKTNSPYPPRKMDFILYERYTSQVSQSVAQRDNYRRYLNVTYDQAY